MATPITVTLSLRQRAEYEQFVAQAQAIHLRATVFLTACVLGGLPDDGVDYGAWQPRYANGVITVVPPETSADAGDGAGAGA
ncbi:hypothetical protein KGQ33_05340 [Patescibacteria group bacterium]|nr:hypothetical protein [Patescibacteria group bacterium]